MARSPYSTYSVDVTGFEALAKKLAAAGISFERVKSMAINRVATRMLTRSRREIVSQVNLKASYVRDRMSLRKASARIPVAIITARRRPTRLATYGARQVTRSARRARGDGLRGIPAGRKQAGVSVSVKAGSGRKRMPGAFLLPLRRGQDAAGGNGMGIFVRTGSRGHADAIMADRVQIGKHRWKNTRSHAGSSGSLRHLYGPSVDQLFNGVAPRLIPDIRRALIDEIQRLAALYLRKAIQ